MRNYWRTLRLTFKYKVTILITVVSAFFLAFSWGLNITALLPLVEISFKGESAISYWNHQIEIQEAFLTQTQKKIEEYHNAPQTNLIPSGELRDLELQSLRTEKRLHYFRRLSPIVENYLPRTPYGTVTALISFVLAASLMNSIFSGFHRYFSARIGLLGIFELREIFFARAVRLEVNYYNQSGTSDTLSRFTHDMNSLSGGISTFYGLLLRDPLKMLVSFIGAALISPRLLLLTLLFFPIIIFTVRWFARRIRRVVRNAMKEMVKLYARITETFRSIRIIKVFNQEETEQKKFRETNQNNLKRILKINKYNAVISPMTDFSWTVILAVIILICSYLVLSEQTRVLGILIVDHPLSLGESILFFAFLMGAFGPAHRLSNIFVGLQSAAAAADRIYEIIDRPDTVAEKTDPKRLSHFADKILFQNVRYSYDLDAQKIEEAIQSVSSDPDDKTNAPSSADASQEGPSTKSPPRFALDGIDLEIPFGETLAIIGPSGCGKSSLLNLIPRFADPSEGTVSLDGIDLRDLNLFDLRQQIGLITQTPILFNGTVEENIRYGTDGKSLDDVVEAAKRAYAHDFITQDLTLGYQTVIGPSGGLLSGGQMQRISIARAFLKDPRILLLDEATSQIDLQSEFLFHKALKDFIGNRTTIIVTHRTGALALADRIVIMNSGKIETIGTHRELMMTNPYYASLFDSPLTAPSR